MDIKTRRKIHDTGNSQYITLPKGWAPLRSAEKSKEVFIIGSDLLVICPEGLEEKAETVAQFITSLSLASVPVPANHLINPETSREAAKSLGPVNAQGKTR
jgi:hypothetical protein